MWLIIARLYVRTSLWFYLVLVSLKISLWLFLAKESQWENCLEIEGIICSSYEQKVAIYLVLTYKKSLEQNQLKLPCANELGWYLVDWVEEARRYMHLSVFLFRFAWNEVTIRLGYEE